MRSTILMAFVLVCGTAQASNWVSVGKNGDGTSEFFVDTTSIRVSKTTRRAWTKTVFAPHSMQDPVLHSGNWWAYAVVRNVFDCHDETIDVEAMTAYYESGGNDSMPDDPTPLRMVPVIPDTAQQAELKLICAWKPK